MNQTLTSPEEINLLIKEKEEQLKNIIETEMSLFKFELALISIPQDEREKATASVKKYREEKWKKALKLADGDEEKAITIYDKP